MSQYTTAELEYISQGSGVESALAAELLRCRISTVYLLMACVEYEFDDIVRAYTDEEQADAMCQMCNVWLRRRRRRKVRMVDFDATAPIKGMPTPDRFEVVQVRLEPR